MSINHLLQHIAISIGMTGKTRLRNDP